MTLFDVIGFSILVGASVSYLNAILFYFMQPKDWFTFLIIAVTLTSIGLGIILSSIFNKREKKIVNKTG